MQTINQKVKFCPHCKKPTLHYSNSSKINWGMHIGLIFLGGIGIITMIGAIFFKVFNLSGFFERSHCSECGKIN